MLLPGDVVERGGDEDEETKDNGADHGHRVPSLYQTNTQYQHVPRSSFITKALNKTFGSLDPLKVI